MYYYTHNHYDTGNVTAVGSRLGIQLGSPVKWRDSRPLPSQPCWSGFIGMFPGHANPMNQLILGLVLQ